MSSEKDTFNILAMKSQVRKTIFLHHSESAVNDMQNILYFKHTF